jgi:hypothetical protein
MIRYPRALEDLDDAVDALSDTWRTRAADHTDTFRNAGSYQNHSAIWSEVKPLYIERQRMKCAYCEKRNENSVIEWDLEHFRPKGKVAAWPPPNTYDFAAGDGFDEGYYLLAYHLENYAAACKTCNSPYKHNHFPIAAARVIGGAHPEDHRGEEAFLIYPLGTGDDDPEDIIAFEGALAIPKQERTHNEWLWKRATVTIDLLGLNREELQALRAELLWKTIWPTVTHQDSELRQKRLDAARDIRAPFASCTRCFLALYERAPEAARTIIDECERVYRRHTGAP